MSILSRPKLYSAQRIDLEDFEVLFEALRTDSKMNIKQFWSAGQYIMKGFNVSGLGGANTVTINLTDATLINSSNTACFSWWSAEDGVSPITVDLQPNVKNYLEIELVDETGTPLTRAFWDQTLLSGEGAEFNEIVDTVEEVNINVVALTGGFSGSPDRIKLAIVETNISNQVQGIIDQRELFWRLGTTLDPQNDYNWTDREEPGLQCNISAASGTFTIGETVTFTSGATAEVKEDNGTNIVVILLSSTSLATGDTITGGTSSETATLDSFISEFTGADKDITNLKDMLDALMTELKKVKGTRFWYQDSLSSISGLAQFINSQIVGITAGSSYSWDGSSLKYTDSSLTALDNDTIAKIKLFGTSQEIVLSRQDGQDGSLVLDIADKEILYITLPDSGDRIYNEAGSGDTNYKVASINTFVVNDENYWLAYREGSKVFVRGLGELQQGEQATIGDDLDFQEDRNAFLRSDEAVSWDGSNLSFNSDIVLEVAATEVGTVSLHTIALAGSPINIPNDGDSVWVEVDRTNPTQTLTVNVSSTTAIPTEVSANRDIFVLFKRIDNAISTDAELYLPFTKQFIALNQSTRLGAGGSAATGTSVVKADYHDPTSTVLPVGVSVVIDGQTGVNGDIVLFTNLVANNNRLYQLSGVGVALIWTPLSNFEAGLDATDGEQVFIRSGDAFRDQLGIYTGTEFTFNKEVRLFNGADFWELSSINNLTLVDNTTDSVFEVSVTGSENFIVSFSIVRGLFKETGMLFVTSDGSTVSVSRSGANIGDAGVEFSGDINVGDLRLRYTTTNTGANATLKYFVQRWSNSAGGPTGIPNYNTSPSSTVPAAGAIGQVQFHGGSGNLDADSNFSWDNTEKALDLNGKKETVLSSGLVVNDAQAAPLAIVSFLHASYKYAIVEYSIERNSENRTGRMVISTNGVNTGFTDNFVETSVLGITFSAAVSGADLEVNYTSTSTGFTGTFKYTIEKWI